MLPDYLTNVSLKSFKTQFDPEVHFGICLATRMPDELAELGFVHHVLDVDEVSTEDYFIYVPKELVKIIPRDKRCFVVLPHLRGLIAPIIFSVLDITHAKPVIVQQYRLKRERLGYNFVDTEKVGGFIKRLVKNMQKSLVKMS